jgi:hypothetical protein
MIVIRGVAKRISGPVANPLHPSQSHKIGTAPAAYNRERHDFDNLRMPRHYALMVILVTKLKALIADKGYDGDAFRGNLLQSILPIVPPKYNRCEPNLEPLRGMEKAVTF